MTPQRVFGSDSNNCQSRGVELLFFFKKKIILFCVTTGMMFMSLDGAHAALARRVCAYMHALRRAYANPIKTGEGNMHIMHAR
jgi:hypothetical protein